MNESTRVRPAARESHASRPIAGERGAGETVSKNRRGLFAGLAALAGTLLGAMSRPAQAGHQGGNTFHLNEWNTSQDFTNLRRETTKETMSWTLGADCIAEDKQSGAIRGDMRGLGTALLGYNQSYAGGTGVWGICAVGVGVLGQNERDERNPGGGYGVLGESPDIGVQGEGDFAGVVGISRRNGVEGYSEKECGVFGMAEGAGIAVCGYKPKKAGGYAGHFIGDVHVSGDFDVQGAKSAVVALPDGTRARLYSMESPESWFEDFGEARLSSGRAEVSIEPRFAAVTRAPYHVFITAYGDSRGLYVASRSKDRFEVRETGGGKGNVGFGYRIVARRKDVRAPRFAQVAPPQAPPPARKPKATTTAKPPPKER